MTDFDTLRDQRFQTLCSTLGVDVATVTKIDIYRGDHNPMVVVDHIVDGRVISEWFPIPPGY